MKKYFFIIFVLSLFLLPDFTEAELALGQTSAFFIDQNYDLGKRSQLTATIRKITPQLYFFIDDQWWDGLDKPGQDRVKESLNYLAEEFETKIYPNLTRTFGQEWSPGVDMDTRIAILIFPMKDGAGGYFNTGDEYPKIQYPESNEKEMFYLNSRYINDPQAKSFLAHEFQHLITFNQKEKRYGVSDDIWLIEARSEFASTFLGYDSVYEGSNLQRRVKSFSDKPFDSLTEWKNTSYDYGVINLFIQYLVDHYGVEILVNSLKTSETGIKSLNYALDLHRFKEDFSDVFENWTIALLVNNCKYGEEYCYLNQNLKNFKIIPLINYISPLSKDAQAVNYTTNDWAGNWHKFIGGNGTTLKLEFAVDPGQNFQVPYLVESLRGDYSIGFLAFDRAGKSGLDVANFGTQNISLMIIPIGENKFSDFSDQDPSYSFFWSASISGGTSGDNSILVANLTAKIEFLKKEILRLQSELADLLASQGEAVSCKNFNNDLYFGMTGNAEVRCLQEFLKSQGQDIYPEGQITGNFLSLTQKAVIRFQEKYPGEILLPANIEKGTGFVGFLTRKKINEIAKF